VPLTYVTTPLNRSPDAQDAGFAMTLARAPAAAAEARGATLVLFAGVLGEETLDDVVLAVSELVTNALLHGDGEIGLRLSFDRHYVTGLVSDDGPGFTGGSREPDPSRIGGHGLHIVGRVAERWGHGAGATHVWFQIAAGR